MPRDKNIKIQNTPQNINSPKPDFNKNDFEIALHQKGYSVIHEKSIHCPCKSEGVGGQLSNCRNCGGTGWAFINPIKTVMQLHSMNYDTQYKEWSETNRGNVSITCRDVEELSFMDRITVTNAISIFNQVLYSKIKDNTTFFTTLYNIKEIEYIGLFLSPELPYKQLKVNEDYTFEYNIIKLDAKYNDSTSKSITIRYKHSPQYHIIDIPRHTMLTNTNVGFEIGNSIRMPIHAIGRYSHYVLDEENFDGDRIIINDSTQNQISETIKNCKF